VFVNDIGVYTSGNADRAIRLGGIYLVSSCVFSAYYYVIVRAYDDSIGIRLLITLLS